MDGNFFSVLPHGKSGNYTLYHVDFSVINRVINATPPLEWENPYKIVSDEEAKYLFKKMIDSIANWLPSIKTAELIGYLLTTRIVLSKKKN